MISPFRSLLIMMAFFATAFGAPAAANGHVPAPPKPHVPKPPRLPLPKPPKLPVPHPPRLPVPHPPKLPLPKLPLRPPGLHPPIHRPPIRFPRSKVIHHPRPIVHRGPVHVRHSPTGMLRPPLRRPGFRTIHRYPIHRVPRRFVRRPYYFYGRGRYSYFYHPGHYRWRSNYYSRGRGLLRPRVVGGIVESVQGIPGSAILVVKVSRPRYGRFRYRAAGRRGTSLRRFSLNVGTLYEVMTVPPRGGTIADLRRGERVLVRTLTNTGNAAQLVRVSRPFRR